MTSDVRMAAFARKKNVCNARSLIREHEHFSHSVMDGVRRCAAHGARGKSFSFNQVQR